MNIFVLIRYWKASANIRWRYWCIDKRYILALLSFSFLSIFFFKQPTVEYIAKDPIIIRLNSPCVVSSPSVNERCALRLLRPHSCLSLFETTSELNDRFEITTWCDKTLSQLSTIQELMKACLWLAETQFTWELYKLNKIFLSRQIETIS